MKTHLINQQSQRKSNFLSTKLTFCLLFFAYTANIMAQKIVPGPILNSNPYNNTVKNVTLFEHDNFNEYNNGNKKVVTQNTPNLNTINNQTTGLIVPLGKKVILYEFAGYGGRKITLYPGNYSHLNGWNDLASSIKIETIPLDEPVAYFFNDTGNIYTNQVFQGFGPEKVDNNSMVCYDCFSKLLIIGPLNVIAYDRHDYSGKNNGDDPFKEGDYNLADWGLNDNISSLEVLSLQYALSKTVLKESRVLSEDTKKTIAIAATGTNTNVSGNFPMKATVSGCFGASATQSFDAATTIGISTAVRTGLEVGVEGVVKATIEYELAAKLETTLTSGSSNTVTEDQCWTMEREMPVPIGCEGKVSLIATPQVQVWTIEKHYVPVDSKGKIVPGGKARIVTGTFTVTKAIGAVSNIALNEGCDQSGNQQNNNPDPDTSNTGNPTLTPGPTPTPTPTPTLTPTPTPTPTPMPTPNRLDNVDEVEFCDGNGTVVGFYTKEGANWTEVDANGNDKFNFSELGRDENSIYLVDKQRQGVRIMLNFHTKEVRYSDNNNPTPFKIYVITDY